ncbi:MAG: hypothetical protein QNJ44_00510 [Rhodobacter sp.]|nr:hypothetical protein [Rhodobacter sp.]
MSERTILDAHLEEHERLLRIARHMAEFAGSDGWPCLTTLDSSLETDQDLQTMTSEIRARYLEGLSEITSRRWRTPPDGIAMPFPGGGEPYAYTYDRQHPPKALESRMTTTEQTGVMLCSSGMAALNVVFQAFNFLMDRRRTLVAFASYFETLSLLRIGPFSDRWSRARSETELSELIMDGKVGIVLLEPVHYNWQLVATDWTDIVTALSDCDHPPIVVLDTTLSGDCAMQTSLIERLRSVTPALICIRSGIKLDQQGLELANLGIVEFWCDDPQLLEKVGSTLKTCRSICGATLTWPDACALAPEPIFGPESFRTYSGLVFETARDLFDRLKQSGELFASVSHPEPPWPAPLVVMELADGGSDNYRDLATLLDHEQRRRGLHWQMSGSFGFRTHRYETILPEELLRPGETHSGALKIAAGCYAGARHEGIIELLLELSSYPDLQTAGQKLGRRHYAC